MWNTKPSIFYWPPSSAWRPSFTQCRKRQARFFRFLRFCFSSGKCNGSVLGHLKKLNLRRIAKRSKIHMKMSQSCVHQTWSPRGSYHIKKIFWMETRGNTMLCSDITSPAWPSLAQLGPASSIIPLLPNCSCWMVRSASESVVHSEEMDSQPILSWGTRHS